MWHVGSALGLNLSRNAEMSFVCFYNDIISTSEDYFPIFQVEIQTERSI